MTVYKRIKADEIKVDDIICLNTDWTIDRWIWVRDIKKTDGKELMSIAFYGELRHIVPKKYTWEEVNKSTEITLILIDK
ncbi:MAG: hypothetical protein OXB92_17385 [Acidimicrobiaceae bacterium]|nr:hypothetical protein [Acidimicrobiaceae bacterium]